MTQADKVTALRIILAPVFFVVFLLPRFVPGLFAAGSGWTVPVLWVLFITAELTDLFDGRIARARGEVSDFGKLFDPFADTLVRIAYFLCFVAAGLFPAPLLLLVLYREYGILFLRVLMMKKGVAMGARAGGKTKTVLYTVSSALALLAESAARLGYDVFFAPLKIAAFVLFALGIAAAIVSFADYVLLYKRTQAR